MPQSAPPTTSNNRRSEAQRQRRLREQQQHAIDVPSPAQRRAEAQQRRRQRERAERTAREAGHAPPHNPTPALISPPPHNPTPALISPPPHNPTPALIAQTPPPTTTSNNRRSEAQRQRRLREKQQRQIDQHNVAQTGSSSQTAPAARSLNVARRVRRARSPSPPGLRFVRPRLEAVPDLSRNAGSSTDATATSATTVVDQRVAEQRQRHHRARERPSQTVPAALLPLPEGSFPRHDLGSMTLQCSICSALHWEFEKSPTSGGATPFKLCCADGKVRLPGMEKPPTELLELLTGDDPVEKIFRDRILDFNESFAMASFGTSKGHGIINGSGPPSFYLSGMAFHRIGTLAPAPADDPVFAQILFLAPTERIQARRRFNGPPEEVRRLDSAYQQIVPVLDAMLRLHNSRVKLFLTAQEFMNSEASHMYQLRLLAPRNRDSRTYNLPTQEEVAVILPGDETEYRSSRREIVVRLRHPPNNDSRGIQFVPDGHPGIMALTYPLLLPYGEDWYNDSIPLSQNAVATEAARRVRDENGVLQRTTDNGNVNPQTGRAGSKRVTQSQFNTYYFHIRPHNISYPTLFLGGRLFQKFVADAWAIVN